MNNKDKRYHKIAFNRRNKTYTIRAYEDGKLIAKYRSYPQGDSYSEHWTEHVIRNFLRYSNDYYIVKK